MSVLGKTSPDPIGVMLGSHMNRFISPTGIEGLANAAGHRLNVLAVVNRTSNRGCLRAFIAQAKLEYKTICVLAVDNRVLHSALLRYGFSADVEIDQFGDIQHMLRWDKPI